MKYYLAIDIGTTNWKAAIFDKEGKMCDIERTPTITHRDDNGNCFYDPTEMWESIKKLIKCVTARTGKTISAVSATSIAEAVVPVDRDGKTVGNIITWFDTRSIAQAEYLKKKFTEEKLYKITGLDVNPIFSLPKVLWVKENMPEIYEKSYKWLQMADYAHSKNCALEGEIGALGLSEDGDEEREQKITTVKEAVEFSEKTGIDVLAISVGNAHGFYKGKAEINVDRIKEIATAVPQLLIVMHGGSDIPYKTIKASILAGIRKFNIATDLKQAYAEKMSEIMSIRPFQIQPLKIFPVVADAVADVAREKIRMFNLEENV